jgi:hypothetical protein
MRTANQYASSIDEWCKIMEKDNNSGYANSWLLGDVNTNEIARLELSLKYVGFEQLQVILFICHVAQSTFMGKYERIFAILIFNK